MNPYNKSSHLSRLTVLVLALFVTVLAQAEGRTILTDFVNAPDEHYSWAIKKIETHGDLTYVVVDLNSLEWLSSAQVNRPQWQHWLELYIPKSTTSDTALLYIGGGRNGRPVPEYENSFETRVANETQTVVALLGQVPNQKLIFNRDVIERREDRLLAHAWTQFNIHKDPNWIPLLPMVKSVVRAMDTISEVSTLAELKSPAIKQFVITGGSKRGWTTWLSAVADERVVAIIPVVFDALNSARSMDHHFQAYGFWSHAIADYFAEGLLGTMGSAPADDFFEVTDPYRYREQLTLPKFIVNATGDEFFLLDSSQFYWNELKGEKYLRAIPNSDHSLEGSDVLQSISTFHWLTKTSQSVPNFDWNWSDSNSVELSTFKGQVVEINKWSAHNRHARDFRLLRNKDSHEARGPTWRQEVVYARSEDPRTDELPNAIEFETNDSGWDAFLVEVVFDVGFQHPLKLTTSVSVAPTALPFAEKETVGSPHLTFNCPASTAEGSTQSILDFLRTSFKAPYVEHVELEDRDYFCWQTSLDPRLEGHLFTEYLQTLGYEECIVQLEAGPGPTLPPLLNMVEKTPGN